MSDSTPRVPEHVDVSELVRRVRAQTPARVLAGRAGPSYRTGMQLELRLDHAAALDAVRSEIDLERDLGGEFLRRWDLFEVATRAATKAEYLMRPDLGRQFRDDAREEIMRRRETGAELQLAIGDGLSAAAIVAQVPRLVPLLHQEASRRGWRVGLPFFIRHCRVGVLNDIGALLRPRVVVLLIGERPGLATAESLSAYLAFEPREGHTDAQRNLVSNIHARGVAPEVAASRILGLAEQMLALGTSGVAIKEGWESRDSPSIAPDSAS